MTTSQSQDGVGPAHRPEHAGLFAAGTNYGLASGFDDTRAHKQVLTAKFRVAHALGVLLKILGLDTDLLSQFLIGCLRRPESGHQFFDFPLIEQILMEEHPTVLVDLIIRM